MAARKINHQRSDLVPGGIPGSPRNAPRPMQCMDSGATSNFISSELRCLALPGTIHKLDKAVPVKTGHSVSLAHETGEFLIVTPMYGDAKTGLCLRVKTYLVKGFANDIHLLSEQCMRQAGLETTSSGLGDSYMYRLMEGMSSHPYCIDDCTALRTPLVRQANGLKGLVNHTFKNFEHLRCWLTGKLVDKKAFKPGHVGVVACEAPCRHSANFMHTAYNVGVPRAKKRLLLLGCGLAQEAALLESLDIDVVAFAEVGGAFSHCVKRLPQAQAFYGVQHLIRKLRSGLVLDVDAYRCCYPSMSGCHYPQGP